MCRAIRHALHTDRMSDIHITIPTMSESEVLAVFLDLCETEKKFAKKAAKKAAKAAAKEAARIAETKKMADCLRACYPGCRIDGLLVTAPKKKTGVTVKEKLD